MAIATAMAACIAGALAGRAAARAAGGGVPAGPAPAPPPGRCATSCRRSAASTSTCSRAASSTRRPSSRPRPASATCSSAARCEAVEASLRPGMQYVVQVRALAELGTEDAGRILERQLQRRLTDDQIEQSWYWIDLASGLRSLNRAQSLPHLLRCAEAAGDIPLGHFFAAETVCFLGFAGYLRQPDTPLGRAALRVLHRALEGLRCGVPAAASSPRPGSAR